MTDAAQPKIHDVIIIGGGPAGLSAAIYAGRARADTVVLDAMGGGGYLNSIDIIENYAGFAEPQKGFELAEAMRKQVAIFGAEITFDQVERLIGCKEVVTAVGASKRYHARSMILATGARHRELCVDGEERLVGRGVSYCATCDGAFFKDKDVIVVGGGDSAIKESLYLSRLVRRVRVIHRRNRLRAEAILQERAFAAENIEFVWDSQVKEIQGEEKVTGVLVAHRDSGEETVLETDGVFIFIGMLPNSEFAEGLVKTDDLGFIRVDCAMRTSHPLVFAAGDVRQESVRQIASAVGDGATAAVHLQELLDTRTPPRMVPPVCIGD